jgi:hypothetical protein
MEITHIRLMDCSHWVPDGYLLSPLRQRGFPPISGSQKDKFKDEFLGYKLTLQYLWSRLLGDKYEESKLVDLHKATDWTRYTSPDEMFGRKLIDEQKRTDLDRFYRIINTEIMSPIEKKWDKVRLNHLFCLDDSYSKKILEPLLSYQEKLSLTIDEKLKCTLLWYDIELLDASQNAIFNGVPAFVALMAGAVELKSKYANGERAIICKFTHPGNSNKNEYSYGVLIETGGSTGFTDYSGWVLSYDCCNDFTGFAGSGHQGAEDLIQEYASKDLIYIRQMNIDKKDFEKFLAENTTAGKKKDIFTLKNEIAETKRTYQAAIDESKGLLHEFISYYTISKRKDSSVDWNIRINGDQLDITCENADSYLIVECKVSSKTMDLESEIKKLKRKLIALDTKKRKIGQFWFYNQPSPAVHEYFKKLQQKYSDNNATIDDYVVISKIIKEDKNWRTKKTDKIETIFNEKSLKSPLADECKNPLSRFPNKKKSILEKIINRISK